MYDSLDPTYGRQGSSLRGVRLLKTTKCCRETHLPAPTTHHVVRANTVARSVLGIKGGYMNCDTIPNNQSGNNI